MLAHAFVGDERRGVEPFLLIDVIARPDPAV
jgi:hypothetical protein